MKPKKIYSIPVALGWIIGSALLSSAAAFSGIKAWKKRCWQRATNAEFLVDRIIQTGPDKKALSSVYLCELMGLAVDKPTHIDHFDITNLQNLLLTSPVIESASVKKSYPNAIYVDYTVRSPTCYVMDFENVAVDQRGYIFPLQPFYTPKRLPSIYIGDPKVEGFYIGNNLKFQLAMNLLSLIQSQEVLKPIRIERIDVSNSMRSSIGRQEIIVILRNGNQRHILRLSKNNYAQDLGNYISLMPKLQKTQPYESIIDLRLSKMAYIEENPL